MKIKDLVKLKKLLLEYGKEFHFGDKEVLALVVIISYIEKKLDKKHEYIVEHRLEINKIYLINEIMKMEYDNYGNGSFDEWYSFLNDKFYIQIRGDLVKKLHQKYKHKLMKVKFKIELIEIKEL